MNPHDFFRALGRGAISETQKTYLYMCQGLNSHYFHVIGDGHQPNSRGLYTHYKDSIIKGGRSPIPNTRSLERPWHICLYCLQASIFSGFRKNISPKLCLEDHPSFLDPVANATMVEKWFGVEKTPTPNSHENGLYMGVTTVRTS